MNRYFFGISQICFVALLAHLPILSGCGEKYTFDKLPDANVAVLMGPNGGAGPQSTPTPTDGTNPNGDPTASPSPSPTATSLPSLPTPSPSPSTSPSPTMTSAKPTATPCPPKDPTWTQPTPTPSPCVHSTTGSTSPCQHGHWPPSDCPICHHKSPPTTCTTDGTSTPAPAPTAGTACDGVFINITEVDLDVQGSSGSHAINLAQNLGPVNMSQISTNVLKALGDLKLSPGYTLQSLRLLTSDQGSYVMKGCQKLCDLKIPSGSESGVKLQFGNLFLQSGTPTLTLPTYDASSVVMTGNGKCILHPSYQGTETSP